MISHGDAPVSHGGGPRPSLGFLLATAFLLLTIFSLSGIFSCCYYYRKLRLTQADLEAAGNLAPTKPELPPMENENKSLSVIMPGDDVPKFVALPCPCAPPRQGTVVVEVPPVADRT